MVALSAEGACGRCASPLEDGDLRCAVCALPVEVRADAVARARVRVLRCSECGAAIAYDANHQAPACAFCRSVMEIEQPADPIEEARRRVPFTVDHERAAAALRGWLGRRGWLAPRALRDEAIVESIAPLCWAAWVVDARAQVAWTADSDAGAQRSAWAPHAGELAIDFGNIVVPASRGLTAYECARLAPYYDLHHAVPASTPDDVPAVIESFDAQRSSARATVQRAIDAAAKARVERVVPGRRKRKVRVACLVERQTTERFALPAWVLAYRFRGAPYRAIVHGQRAEVVVGTAPVDWTKVAWLALVGVVVAVIALALALR